jgi:hypothetical protein
MIIIVAMTKIQIKVIQIWNQKKLNEFNRLTDELKLWKKTLLFRMDVLATNIYYFWNPLLSKRVKIRRDGRVVECGGLENRCSPSGEPGVRIPLSPQSDCRRHPIF